MPDKTRKPKTYNLSPTVSAWTMETAARLTIENGRRVSESDLVDDILFQAMTSHSREENEAGLTKILRRINRRKELAR